MSQKCSIDDCPPVGPDYHTVSDLTAKLKLIRSLLAKVQEQGTQQIANQSSVVLTDSLQDSYLLLIVIILAIFLIVVVAKMAYNLKAERRQTLTALGEAKWMVDVEKGIIRHDGPPVV